MTNKDPNYLIKVEKAIIEKYGKETVNDPRSFWTKEKEEEYVNEIKKNKLLSEESESDKELVEGVLIARELITKEIKRTCISCKIYSFDRKDDLYMEKFKTCFLCYVKLIEDREDKWKQKLLLIEKDSKK